MKWRTNTPDPTAVENEQQRRPDDPLGAGLSTFMWLVRLLWGAVRSYFQALGKSKRRLLGEEGWPGVLKAAGLIFISLQLFLLIAAPQFAIVAPVVSIVLLIFALVLLRENSKAGGETVGVRRSGTGDGYQRDSAFVPLTSEPQPMPQAFGEHEEDANEGADEDAPEVPARSTDEILTELDAMIGLAAVKNQVRDWIADQEVVAERERRGLPGETRDYTLKLIGPPGTGKTETARLLGELFRSLELLPSGHLVELQRADIIGEYQGHSANAMKRRFQEAMGGVLFIDEVQSLVIGGSGDTFGKEIVSTLVKLMEDNRGQVAVIIAGYNDEVEGFLKTDPGLESRFLHEIYYQPYTVPELVAITEFQLQREGGRYLAPEARRHIQVIWEQLLGDPQRDERTWGNGREARMFVQYAIRAQSARLHPRVAQDLSDDELQQITLADVVEAWRLYDGDDETAAEED